MPDAVCKDVGFDMVSDRFACPGCQFTAVKWSVMEMHLNSHEYKCRWVHRCFSAAQCRSFAERKVLGQENSSLCVCDAVILWNVPSTETALESNSLCSRIIWSTEECCIADVEVRLSYDSFYGVPGPVALLSKEPDHPKLLAIYRTVVCNSETAVLDFSPWRAEVVQNMVFLHQRAKHKIVPQLQNDDAIWICYEIDSASRTLTDNHVVKLTTTENATEARWLFPQTSAKCTVSETFSMDNIQCCFEREEGIDNTIVRILCERPASLTSTLTACLYRSDAARPDQQVVSFNGKPFWTTECIVGDAEEFTFCLIITGSISPNSAMAADKEVADAVQATNTVQKNGSPKDQPDGRTEPTRIESNDEKGPISTTDEGVSRKSSSSECAMTKPAQKTWLHTPPPGFGDTTNPNPSSTGYDGASRPSRPHVIGSPIGVSSRSVIAGNPRRPAIGQPVAEAWQKKPPPPPPLTPRQVQEKGGKGSEWQNGWDDWESWGKTSDAYWGSKWKSEADVKWKKKDEEKKTETTWKRKDEAWKKEEGWKKDEGWKKKDEGWKNNWDEDSLWKKKDADWKADSENPEDWHPSWKEEFDSSMPDLVKRWMKKKCILRWRHGENVTRWRIVLRKSSITDAQLRTLRDFLLEAIKGDAGHHFDNIELSENRLTDDGMDALFDVLQKKNVTWGRFSIYGHRMITDRSIHRLAALLKEVTVAPLELHLSDCSITDVGFSALLDALKSNPAFPRKDHKGKSVPLWTQLRKNYISQACINDSAEFICDACKWDTCHVYYCSKAAKRDATLLHVKNIMQQSIKFSN